jgi:chaperonin cofactor prefoldin
MQLFCAFALLAFTAVGERGNPLSEAISLLNDLHAKITAEGTRELKAFNEYASWCGNYAADSKNEIKTATMEKNKLEAEIAELSSEIVVADSKIGDLAGAISSADVELKDATAIRTKESADFHKSDTELVEAVDVLDRAIAVLQREMQKNPAALVQVDTSNMKALLQSLGAVIDAASFNSADRQSLIALVQSRQEADSDDGDVGAPAAAVYKTHSTNVVDVLQDMREKAEVQLSNLRKGEMNTKHNFEMLKQSLEDQIAADKKDMDGTKGRKSAAKEGKAIAEGDLQGTITGLGRLNDGLAAADTTCKQVAADHASTTAARTEELKVIAEAIQVLTSTTSGAEGQTYSLLQVEVQSSLRTSSDLARLEVLALVKKLAKDHHSAALAQLASRIAATVRLGEANGEDVFAKVKALIRDLVSRLESEAGADATEKAFCDDELAKTKAKKEELDDDVSKMTSKIDIASARSAELKSDVKVLQAELAALARTQNEMDRLRVETHSDYVQAKADLEQGLGGVRRALVVLRDYYAKDSAAMVDVGALMQQPAKPELFAKAGGAGTSIIGILEVILSDFASNLAKEETQEAGAQAGHEKMSQQNAITKTTKEQDVKYKTGEFKSLDKNINEISSDRSRTNTELDAVLDYYAKLQGRCIAKPETYETRRDHRAAEIAGLRRAQEILENEVAFVQRKHRGGNIRGALMP